MKIRNLTQEMIIIGSTQVPALSTMDFSNDFSSDFNFMQYKDEFISAFNESKIIFLDNGIQITDISQVLSYFGSSEVNNAKPETNTEDFYYNFKVFDMDYQETKDIQFEGFVKTIDIFTKSGEINMQIVKPLMNKIKIPETSNYSIDCDYKLKDPVIRLTCIKKAQVSLYMDGTYYNKTKTKDQYLSEIYSDTLFPESSIIADNSLVFKTNFKKLMKSEFFIDSIGGFVGSTFNNANLLNFNKFEDGSYVKFPDILKFENDFTFNIWFKLEDNLQLQTIYCKDGYLEVNVESGILTTKIANNSIKLTSIKSNSWYMLTIARSSNNLSFYLNDELITSTAINCTFPVEPKYVYFGCKSPALNCIRSGEIGECSLYNYHFSSGLVKYLYMNNHPLFQVQTNLLPGCYVSTYKNESSIEPSTAYDFTMIEKENVRVSKLKSSSITDKISIIPGENEITVFTGKIFIQEDDKYQFIATGDNFVAYIDNKPIMVNSNTTIYLEEGYYKFKCTVTGSKPFSLKYVNKSNTLEVPLFIEDSNDNESSIDESTVLFSLNDVKSNYGITFEDNGPLYNGIYSTLSNIPENINSPVYTISFNYKAQEKDATIFGQGLTWEPNFELRLKDQKFIFTNQGASLITPSINLFEDYNIQITSTGSVIYFYINGALKAQKATNFVTKLKSTDNLYIGRLADGYKGYWMDGNFEIRDFKWYLKYFTEDEVINSYITRQG